ncbi:hypothetical protein DB347_01170 [Opitutaceae bacterium EW11]|nr:hypothetical protein DB347_01170 [Opitutaceae bacterium EW11]
MKNILLTMAATIAVFALGVLAGRWMQRTQPVPPPPIGIMGEIRDVPLSGSPYAPGPAPLRDPRQLRAELDRMRPAIEEFRRKVEPIKTEFREKLQELLTSEQREKLNALDERFSASPPANSNGPGSRRHPRMSHDGIDSIFPIVIVSAALDRLTEELKLNEGQQTAVRALLVKRREQFLELVDTSPPPSLRLGRIAPWVPRIAEPPAK